MKVRSVEESAHRYFRNSLRAYLEGKKDLRWVTAMIGQEPEQAARAMRAFNEIAAPTDPQRRIELLTWLMPRLQDEGSAHDASKPDYRSSPRSAGRKR